MNIFEKLMIARQISFKDGSVYVVGARVVVPPAAAISEHSLMINENPEYVQTLYESSKEGFRQTLVEGLPKLHGFDVNDFMKWSELSIVTGWGVFDWQDLDYGKKSATVLLENSPVGTMLAGKVKKPVDHIARGFIAGTAEVAFKEEVDCVEIECVALGAKRCRFAVGARKDLEKTAELKRQVGS